MHVSTLLVIDRLPVLGPWSPTELHLPGAFISLPEIPGVASFGAFLEVTVDPRDTVSQQVQLYAYARPLDDALRVLDVVDGIFELFDGTIGPVGRIQEPWIQSQIVWVPSWRVRAPHQLWLEARLNGAPQAERPVAIVPAV